jgi:hypothetical protein
MHVCVCALVDIPNLLLLSGRVIGLAAAARTPPNVEDKYCGDMPSFEQGLEILFKWRVSRNTYNLVNSSRLVEYRPVSHAAEHIAQMLPRSPPPVPLGGTRPFRSRQ